MKTNQEILDKFGKLVSTTAFDSQYRSLNQVLTGEASRFIRLKEVTEFFNRFTLEEKKIIQLYLYNLLSGTLFDFLKIFEENPEFKIIYEEDGKQIDLEEISEMLKAEPIIENGWIERFSKELNNEK
jgi:hypothetical protein